MRAIKLKEGECLVCGNKRVADGCFENIIKILEKNESSKEINKEFMRMFGMHEKLVA